MSRFARRGVPQPYCNPAQDGAEKELERLRSEFYRRRKDLVRQIEEAKRLRRLDGEGLDVRKVQTAERWLAVEGWCDSEPRREVVERFARDLAAGDPDVRERYGFVKVYAHFGEQTGRCSYGYLPDHGRVVFRVGFHEAFALGVSGFDPKADLPADALEACLYYLEAVKERRIFGKGRS